MTDRLSSDYLKKHAKNGGWPYFPGKEPATEATVLCALACRSDSELSDKAIEFLLTIRNPDGGWSSGHDLGESDWNSALALFAIARLSNELKTQKKLSAAVESKIEEIYKASALKLNSMRADYMTDMTRTVLTAVSGPDFDYERGWPWESNTWHWVEPTSYALLAFKAGTLFQQKPYSRSIQEAQSYLYSKTCKGGGWNWGQVHTLGFDFVATPQATAFALLALQDQQAHPKVKEALEVLRNAKGAEADTTSAQSLSIIARHACGEDVTADIAMLQKGYLERVSLGENLCTLALATIATQIPSAGNPFKLDLPQGDVK